MGMLSEPFPFFKNSKNKQATKQKCSFVSVLLLLREHQLSDTEIVHELIMRIGIATLDLLAHQQTCRGTHCVRG